MNEALTRRPGELVVALSTSGPIESVAVGLPDGAVWHHAAKVVRGAPRTLTAHTERLLAEAGASWRDVAIWACDVGPGSFTGVRMGIAIAQAFAWAHGAATVGVGAFAAIARGVGTDAPLLLTLPARRGVHYAGLRDPHRRWHEAEIADTELSSWVASHVAANVTLTVGGAFRPPARPSADQPLTIEAALPERRLRPGPLADGPDAADVLACALATLHAGTPHDRARLAPRYLGVPAAARGSTKAATVPAAMSAARAATAAPAGTAASPQR